MQSFEPGEDWFWDFETDEDAAGPQLVPPLHHPEDQPAPGPAGVVSQDWVQTGELLRLGGGWLTGQDTVELAA